MKDALNIAEITNTPQSSTHNGKAYSPLFLNESNMSVSSNIPLTQTYFSINF